MTVAPSLVTGVDFVSIPAKDLQESRGFYADVLGLEPSSVWQRPGAEPVGAELESRGVEFKGEIVDSGVCRQTFFEGPAGNTLALHHRYAPRGG